MTPARPRVILDCNILLQAILSPDGPGAACVALVDSGQIELVTSRATLAEAREVLNRPELLRLKPDLRPEAKRLRQLSRNRLAIVTPDEFLTLMRGRD